MSKDQYPGVMEITVRWNPDPSNKKSQLSSCTSLLTQPFLELGKLSSEEMADLGFRETYQRLQRNLKKGGGVIEYLEPDNLKIRVALDQDFKTHNYGNATKLRVQIKRAINFLKRRI